MGKILLQFLAIIALFFSIWFGLSRIDYVGFFKLDKIGDDTEQKLGDLVLEMLKQEQTEIELDKVLIPVNKVIDRICAKNNITRSSIKLHVIEQDEVNAFALPDRHLVVYTGLIQDCKNPEELSGVIAHEIAHMEHNHVMKKMAKEIGFSVLIAITSGKASPEIMKQAMKLLSSTAYDRSLETDADLTGIDYLLNAEIDPKPMSDFLYRMSLEEADTPEHEYLISTHPDSKVRSAGILRKLEGKKIRNVPVMTNAEWEKLKGME